MSRPLSAVSPNQARRLPPRPARNWPRLSQPYNAAPPFAVRWHDPLCTVHSRRRDFVTPFARCMAFLRPFQGIQPVCTHASAGSGIPFIRMPPARPRLHHAISSAGDVPRDLQAFFTPVCTMHAAPCGFHHADAVDGLPSAPGEARWVCPAVLSHPEANLIRTAIHTVKPDDIAIFRQEAPSHLPGRDGQSRRAGHRSS